MENEDSTLIISVLNMIIDVDVHALMILFVLFVEILL